MHLDHLDAAPKPYDPKTPTLESQYKTPTPKSYPQTTINDQKCEKIRIITQGKINAMQ